MGPECGGDGSCQQKVMLQDGRRPACVGVARQQARLLRVRHAEADACLGWIYEHAIVWKPCKDDVSILKGSKMLTIMSVT